MYLTVKWPYLWNASRYQLIQDRYKPGTTFNHCVQKDAWFSKFGSHLKCVNPQCNFFSCALAYDMKDLKSNHKLLQCSDDHIP